MATIYDVLLQRHTYDPEVIGYYEEPKYICIFYDDDRDKALKAMGDYVKTHGFLTPDKKFSIATVVLRERESTGKVIKITPYHELFDVITQKLK